MSRNLTACRPRLPDEEAILGSGSLDGFRTAKVALIYLRQAVRLLNDPLPFESTQMDKQAVLSFTLLAILMAATLSSCGTDGTSEAAELESGEISRFLPPSDSDLPVRAFLFPGRSDRRALIISGIHGDEIAAIEVVERLRVLLKERSAAGDRPFFTTMLVPILIDRSRATEKRYVPRGIGFERHGKKLKVVQHPIEPNLNFPLPGEDYERARRRGLGGPHDPELVIQVRGPSGKVQERSPRGPLTSIRMLPETRFLLQLIERFQPERLAAIHAHSRMSLCHPCKDTKETACGGEGPGIFVDPRGIDPMSGSITRPAEWKADKLLAHRMVQEALRRLKRRPLPTRRSGDTPYPPFAGNHACPRTTVLYFSPRHSEGNSLGDWAPVPTRTRPGITTVTIELPKYRRTESKAARRVIQLHRDLLADVFLDTP